MARGTADQWRERGLHARVIDALGEEIVDGRFATGAVLNLDVLSERFSVSRSVLREAIRVLQSLGMVVPRQRVGTQVLPRIEWDLMNPQLIVWRGRGPEYFDQMRELLQLRLGIEPVAARLSARSMIDDDRERLVAASAAMVEATRSNDGRMFLESDIDFHTLLLRGSGNAVVGHFATTVEALLRTRTEERRFTITEYTPSSVDRHTRLAEAVRAGDEEASYRWSFEMLEATLAEFESEAPASARPGVI